ncbi:MAG: DUF4861 family protein [Phycisphaerales bacterium]|nr:DUF4861 family protein [Phycisphaerales bacterium]MBT7170962.1 DUF4861 family protein [Phycisphaerales bacterium]
MMKMTRTLTIGLMVLAALGCNDVKAETATPAPGATFAEMTSDGAWCWFSDPRAIYDNGKTIAGWVNQSGDVMVGAYDIKTGEIETVALAKKFQRDDHDNPSFLVLPDGRYMALYSRHGDPSGLRYKISTKPGSISKWSKEMYIKGAAGGKKIPVGHCYTNPAMLSAEKNRIYIYGRVVNWQPSVAWSDDGGKTFTKFHRVISSTDTRGNRPYVKYANNGKDTIYIAFTDGHPRNEPTNSIYFMAYKNGAFYKAGGTKISDMKTVMAGTPIKQRDCDVVHDATGDKARCWIWDVAFDAAGNPALVYSRCPAETNHEYWYAKFDGKTWITTKLTDAGKWFPQTTKGAKEREPHYSAGLNLDHNDPSNVYLAKPVNGVFEIFHYTTADGGETFTNKAITKGSKKNNVRPFPVRYYNGTGPKVLWMEGYYRHYTDYKTSIRMTPAKTPEPRKVSCEPAAMLGVIREVGDYEIAHPSPQRTTDWTMGAHWTGMMACYRVTQDPKYRRYMETKFDAVGWKPGRRPYHADDHTVCQTYLDLYAISGQKKMLAPTKKHFDKIMSTPPKREKIKGQHVLEHVGKGTTEVWSWCDALYMAPPAFARLYTATGDTKYLDWMDTMWWRTSDYLYDAKEGLYYRDSRYFGKKTTPNGAKVFWSRGNGWVIGGLVRVLQHMPMDYPSRPKYIKQLREMAATLKKRQGKDGLWNPSLLDFDDCPGGETSGSGFFTYAICWGINNGILDAKEYWPTVEAGWKGLMRCVDQNGKLCYVQPIGAAPNAFSKHTTQVYGTGAFMLAGAEVLKYQLTHGQTETRVSLTNPSNFARKQHLTHLPKNDWPKNMLILDARSGEVVPHQITLHGVFVQLNFLPKETRIVRVVELEKKLPIQFEVRTMARFVPERMDDFAWETDRIGFRTFGPTVALPKPKGEGLKTSGVDVWTKSTREMIVNKFYKNGSYHKDHGEGMDYFKVGSSAGCGAIGSFKDGKFTTAKNFLTSKILYTGPLASEFELTYPGEAKPRMIAIGAGGWLYYTSAPSVENPAAGIVLHTKKAKVTIGENYVTVWEEPHGEDGITGMAIVAPDGFSAKPREVNGQLVVPLKEPYYFAGACWNKSGDFTTAAAWNAHVKQVPEKANVPIIHTILNR